MGERKTEVEDCSAMSCCRVIFITISVASMISAFGVINYLQFEEIVSLQDRVKRLEDKVFLVPVVSAPSETDPDGEDKQPMSRGRARRQAGSLPPDSLTQFISTLVQQEVTVLQQYCGNSSKICLPGPPGPKGVEGIMGLRGQKGDRGSDGVPGPKGSQGNYGVPGIPGLKGDRGDVGLKGDPGIQGTQGLKGEAGVKGQKGEYGPPGVPGVKGVQGAYGVPGVPGLKGEPGAQGLGGAKGQKGDEGRPLPFDKQCCSTLQKPKYSGNANEVINAYVGQSVTLPCSTSGYPPPTTTFNPATDPSGRSRYTMGANGMAIQSVQLTDSREFVCSVSNIFGLTEKHIQLIVTEPVVATSERNFVNVAVGDRLRVACDISGAPAPTVTWQHVRPDGQTVPVLTGVTSSNGKSTIIIPAANAVDAGKYICQARNKYETDQATTDVTVTGKPQITSPPKTQTVFEGSTVTLKCDVVSNPPSKVTWNYPLTNDKAPLNAQLNPDNSVTLVAVDNFNSGVYTCTATNAQGTTSAQATLKVEQKLEVTATPHVLPITGAEVVLNMQCSAKAFPQPQITWSKEGSPSLTGNSKYLQLSGGNLIVTSVDSDTDTGIYDCIGTNKNGNATDSVVVFLDQGQLTCTTTYTQARCEVGQICGGRCPSNCQNTANNIYGITSYPDVSSVCVSGLHAGALPTTDNLVLWKHQAKLTTYPPTLSHGIQSLQTAQTQETNTILKPGTKQARTGQPTGTAVIG